MKKILSIIAALAMIMAMVGCDLIDMSFKVRTYEFDNQKIYDGVANQNSVYPIEDFSFLSGQDVIDIERSTEKVTDEFGSTNIPALVTIKSKKEGTAKVTFKSPMFAKEAANVEITVSSAGFIYLSPSLKDYTYYRSDYSNSDPTRGWMDKPALNPFEMESVIFTDISAGVVQNARSIEVNGNIVYMMYWKESSTYYMVRTIIEKGDDGKCYLTVDTVGRATYSGNQLKYWAEEYATDSKIDSYTNYGAYVDWNGSTVELMTTVLNGQETQSGFILSGGTCGSKTYSSIIGDY